MDTDAILALAPFGRLPAPDEPRAPDGAAPVAFDMSLRGVVIASRADASRAILDDGERARAVRVGEAIRAGVRLVAVSPLGAELEVAGERQILSFPREAPNATGGPTHRGQRPSQGAAPDPLRPATREASDTRGLDRLRALTDAADQAFSVPSPIPDDAQGDERFNLSTAIGDSPQRAGEQALEATGATP